MRKNPLFIKLKFLFSKFFIALGFLLPLCNIACAIIKANKLEIYDDCLMYLNIGVVVASLLFMIAYIFNNKVVLFAKGNKKITVKYGNIFSEQERKNHNIILIPVNDCFDTIVDEPGSVSKPLVSPQTLHASLIKHAIEDCGMTVNELNTAIKNLLIKSDVQPLKVLNDKIRGNKYSYPMGTCIYMKLPKDNNIYCLFVLTRFNEMNTAELVEPLKMTFEKVLESTYHNSQGAKLVIPLFGTGLSNAPISHSESLAFIFSDLYVNIDKLRGEADIVVYKKDRSKVSIYQQFNNISSDK